MTRYYNAAILLLIWSIFFHLLRNISGAYVALQAGVFVLCAILFYCRYELLKSDGLLIVVLISLSFYVLTLSVIYNEQYGEAAPGIFRFISLIISLLSALIIVRSGKVALFWRCFSVFVALCALSLYFQFIFGAIDWFAEASERAGFSRYASLAGSLTVYGVVCGMAIISSFYYFMGWRRILLIAVVVSGGFISLQKAAIANVVLAAICIAVMQKVSFKNVFRHGLVIAVLGILVLWSSGLIDIAEIAFKSSVGAAGDGLQSDVSLLQSAFDRLVELPGIVFDFYGFNRMFWGVGVFGGAGSLGYSELPMMHNAYFDIVSIAGIPVFIGLLLYFFSLLWKAYRYWRSGAIHHVETKVVILIFFMSMVNMFFASGNFFQPVIAIVLWVSVIYVARLRM